MAFEPDPDNFALLRRNVELNGYGNVELVNAAVSDKPGRCRLFRCGDNAGDHRLHAAPDDRPSVEVVTVDAVSRSRAGGVDFVKMDVQGCEGAALEGMAGVLAKSPRVRVVTEFWPHGLERAGYGGERLLGRLAGMGFRLYEIDEAGLAVRRADPRKLIERFPASGEGFTNLLCVKAPLGGLQ